MRTVDLEEVEVLQTADLKEVEILRGLCHAFASTSDLDEAAQSIIRWVRVALAEDVDWIRVSVRERDRFQTLAFDGASIARGDKYTVARRTATATKKPDMFPLRRRPGRACAIFPMVSRGELMGLIEMIGSESALERRRDIVEAVASQGGVVLKNAKTKRLAERDVTATKRAAALAQALISVPTRESAVRTAMIFCFENLKVPVAAWLTNGNPREMKFVGARGLGAARRQSLRSRLGSISRSELGRSNGNASVQAGFAAIAGVDGVEVVDAGEAVILLGQQGVEASSRVSIDLIEALLQDVLRHLDVVGMAERRNQRLQTGIAWMAHEVRGPLTGAAMAIDHLMTRDIGKTELGLLRASYDDLQELAQLIDALLRWSVGAASLERRPTDLVRLVAKVIDKQQPDERTRISMSSPPSLVVRADPRHLSVAISNVIRNALSYSPSEERVQVNISTEEGVATVRVEDKGPGVSEPERHTIFDPYVRGRSNRPGRGNKGLGLFIARRVVEAHNGKIWVESKNGRGASFMMTLPVQGDLK